MALFQKLLRTAGRFGRRTPVWTAAGAAALCAVMLPYRAKGAPQARVPSPEAEAQIAAGAQQFQQSCAFCHGPDATGGRGPDLIRSALVAHDVEGNLIGPVIRNGRPDQGMPPQALSEAQIKAVAAFLHHRARQSLDSSQLPKTYALSKLLTGNAAEGRAYFEGAGGCTACHSAGGDLKGIATRLSPLDLEARMLYPGRAASTVTVTLASGEKVTGLLDHIDEFTVALRDSSGWYRSYSRAQVQVEVHDPLEAHRRLLGAISQSEFHNLFAYLETLK